VPATATIAPADLAEPADLADIDAYTLADGARRAGIGAVLHGLKPQSSAAQFIGRARTARIDYRPHGQIPLAEYGTGALLESCAPGDCLLLDGGGIMLTAMGDLAVHALHRSGAAAAIINACVRDIEAIEQIGLPVFARGPAITTMAGRAKIVGIGDPVTIDGVTINNGDLIAGCRGGIVAIPWQDRTRALTEARRVLTSDQQMLAGIEAGESFSTLWAKHKALPSLPSTQGN